MQNKYFIERNIDKFKKDGYTYFLDGSEIKMVMSKLKNYNVYEPFIDCDYKILYSLLPNVVCFKIKCKNKLKHSDIMGALCNLNINDDLFGDIIVLDDYYFLALEEISLYIRNNLTTINRYKASLEICDLPIFERQYEDKTIIVASKRIDCVVAKLINLNRRDVHELILKKDIFINYQILNSNSYLLKDNDIFSIRKYGKFMYNGIEKYTKKDNLIINIKKYI